MAAIYLNGVVMGPVLTDTSANWTASNIAIDKNTICLESDTLKIKIGDGVNVYSNLEYVTVTPSELTQILDSVKKDVIRSAFFLAAAF